VRIQKKRMKGLKGDGKREREMPKALAAE
jgi:hypothetical protein